jgi:hypothetical protein
VAQAEAVKLKLFFTLLALPALSAFFPPAVSPAGIFCDATEKHAYLSKDYVDTIVQKAFNSLNDAAGFPGAEVKHKQAINEARRTARKLRDQANGDPNEKYILFRVSELEQQLVLEENDIVLRKSREAQKIKNTVIDSFNFELGKKRPDFSGLNRLILRMQALDDQNKSEEMKRSFSQRKAAVSREWMYRFEKIFLTGEVDTVRREFDYCTGNRAFLLIPDSTFEKISRKIQLQAEAVKKRPGLEASARRARESFDKGNYRETWLALNGLRATLDQVKGFLSFADWNSLDSRARSILSALDRREDSLVNAAVVLYDAKGEDPALAFIEKALKGPGVSEKRVASASMYVLSRGAKRPGRDSLISREVDALNKNPASAEIDLGDMRALAKQRAKAKADSIRTAEETKAGILVMEIYSLLEQNKADDAIIRFNGNLGLLQTYIFPEMLQSLSTSVAQAYSAYQEEKSRGTSSIAMVGASNSADELKSNQEKAASHISQIYALLQQGKAGEAFQHFTKFHDKLKQFVCKEAFDMVETSVTQAYNSQK